MTPDKFNGEQINKKAEKVAYKGKMIEVVEVEMGTWTKEFARRAPGTRLIIEKDGKILLSREFRHELNRYDYRLPGGKVYDSLAEYTDALAQKVDMREAAEKAAKKEAREEVGVDAKQIDFLDISECGATMEWDLYYYRVTDFDEVPQDLGEGEDITAEYVDKEKALKMCLEKQISEDRSAMMLMRYLMK